MTACTASSSKITFGTSTSQPLEMYEHMGYIHVGMWSDPGKNICILLAPRRCCLGKSKFGAKSWSTNGATAPSSARSSVWIMAIQSFWRSSARSIGSIRCLRANHPPESLRGKLAAEEGGPNGAACDGREPDGCAAAVSPSRTTGGEEGKGDGEGQPAIGKAEGGLTKEEGMNLTAGIVLLVVFVAMLWFGKPRNGVQLRFMRSWIHAFLLRQPAFRFPDCRLTFSV